MWAVWKETYTQDTLRDRATTKVTASCQAQSDRVTMPAGTFDAIKVTCRNARTK